VWADGVSILMTRAGSFRTTRESPT
jgi:hypothetical protein